MLVGQKLGPFEIDKELGSGAMGSVYRAQYQKDGEASSPVAIKMVALGLLGNESAMARFEREASILKQLRHPHIVRLIATGRWRKTPFIAMEYIDGEALDRVLARRGRLGWEEVATYGRQLGEALQYAHDKGIIHRDLKPSNLMLTSDGVLKLTDFGIAKDTDVTALTGMNSTIGTAAYMSPEQCKGDKNLTAKSDLYSLGIVFFELLTGRKPFTAETTVDMFLKHVNEAPPRVHKLVENLPTKFASLILQLLEKDKADRPQDAAWVVRMLEEVEADAIARKSAGLDAAKARRGDRRFTDGDSTIDEADREAARALKGITKKKKKKKAVPLLQQTWVKATGLVMALVVLVGIAYFGFIKSPSAATMFAEIEAASTSKEKQEAAEQFLKAHGEKGGEKVDQAAAVFRAETVREREKQLANRFNSKKWREQPEDNDDPKAYAAAMMAIDFEKQGNLKAAGEKWSEVQAAFPEAAKLPYTFDEAQLAKAKWGWVAEKRLRDLEEAKTTLARLRKEIEEIRDFEKPAKNDAADPESQAIRALRFQEFPDVEKAARIWDALITQTETKPELRVWLLIATEQRVRLPKETPDNATAARAQRITEKLDEADGYIQQWQADPNAKAFRKKARVNAREVLDLYDDEEKGRDQLTDAVKRAQAILTVTG